MGGNSNGRVSRFFEIARRLQSAGVPHFTTTVMQNALEIPAPFVRDHGEGVMQSASLRLGSGSKVWPVKIYVSECNVRFRVRFCQLWREFLSDNGLKKGDELIVSLVAKSEFVIYMLKRNLDSRRLSGNSQFNDTTSGTSGDVLPDANAQKYTLRKLPLHLSTPELKAEMQQRNISDNCRASSVTLDRGQFLIHQMAETERYAKIPDNGYDGTIFFQKE